MPLASRRLSGYSGEVRSQHRRGPASTCPVKLTWNDAMFGSVLPARERIGVSTSSTPRSAKNARTAALSLARSCSAAGAAEGRQPSLMCLEELQQLRLVPHVDAQLFCLGQLRTGGLA